MFMLYLAAYPVFSTCECSLSDAIVHEYINVLWLDYKIEIVVDGTSHIQIVNI